MAVASEEWRINQIQPNFCIETNHTKTPVKSQFQIHCFEVAAYFKFYSTLRSLPNTSKPTYVFKPVHVYCF